MSKIFCECGTALAFTIFVVQGLLLKGRNCGRRAGVAAEEAQDLRV
jgi:hypothetical protein